MHALEAQGGFGAMRMMSADYIPFINSAHDCEIAKKRYSDAHAVRISLETAKKTCRQLPSGPKRWVDPAIDGLHNKWTSLTDSYKDHITQFTGYELIADPQFQSGPDKSVVQQFVSEILSSCNEHAPDWISIPQLPLVDSAARNKINKLLAESANAWARRQSFRGKLILPAIFTNQRQINQKTDRNKKVASILGCLDTSAAHGVWVVDSSLNDQEGSGTFDKRFEGLRNFHEELDAKLPDDVITICGPYWGMNMVLWARGVARFSAIGLGNSYKYNIPGAMLPQGKVRVALTPLRRWAVATPKLRKWLTDSVAKLSPNDPMAGVFSAIERNFPQDAPSGRLQVATFYSKWFHKFSSLPPAGRALALYQDLSNAYVLGTTFDDLPSEEKAARKPERVAQQLMMNCL